MKSYQHVSATTAKPDQTPTAQIPPLYGPARHTVSITTGCNCRHRSNVGQSPAPLLMMQALPKPEAHDVGAVQGFCDARLGPCASVPSGLSMTHILRPHGMPAHPYRNDLKKITHCIFQVPIASSQPVLFPHSHNPGPHHQLHPPVTHAPCSVVLWNSCTSFRFSALMSPAASTFSQHHQHIFLQPPLTPEDPVF